MKKDQKQIFEIKPLCMCYDNQMLEIETGNHIFQLKDKRAICILADRLSVMKAQINNSEPSDNNDLTKKCLRCNDEGVLPILDGNGKKVGERYCQDCSGISSSES